MNALTMVLALQAVAPSDTGRTADGIYWEAFGAGAPVVLVHAFSVDRRMWDPQLAALAERYRVIRYDQRAHGRSAAVDGPYAAHEDLRGVLDAAGVERAALVGLSSGAQIATDLALADPERVRALVLAGPSLSGWRSQADFSWMAPVIEALRSGDLAEGARKWAATPLMAVPAGPADSAVRRMTLDNAAVWRQPANAQVTLDPPAVLRLEALTMPVLVVLGAEDLPDMHRVADTLTARVRDVRRITLPNAGHLVSLARPEAFTQAVLDFLR